MILDVITRYLITLPIFLVAVVIHEYAHGWAAYKLGDDTARIMGRLTLNPIAHIDIMGTLILPLALLIAGSPIVFGWAKPVPINYSNLRNPKLDLVLVGAAGPVANILLAVLLSLLIKSGIFPAFTFINTLLSLIILINLILAVFNIIPIPPLDGSNILFGILPPNLARQYARLEGYGFLILIVLLYFRLVDKIIWPLVKFLSGLLGLNLW